MTRDKSVLEDAALLAELVGLRVSEKRDGGVRRGVSASSVHQSHQLHEWEKTA